MSIAGPMASLIALGLLAAVTLAAMGAGAFLLRRVATLTSLERIIFGVPLGLGVIAYVVFALGMLRLASPLPLWLGAALSTMPLGALWFLGRGKQAAFRLPNTRSIGPLAIVIAIALTLAGVCTLIGALAPPGGSEWDSLSYHLAAPKTYLREGRIFYIPYDHHSNFPFVVQMLYLLMLSAKSVAAAKLIHWSCGVLLTASVYTFCRRHLGDHGAQIGWIAALLVGTTPIVLWESTTAYIDLAGALFAWLSLYALVNASTVTDDVAAPAGERLRHLIVSAALMGLALGTKTTLLGIWAAMLVAILWPRLRQRAGVGDALRWGGLSLLIGAPWYVKTWLYTGNPVYPFAYGLFGGRYWSAQNAGQYAAEQALFGMGKDPAHLLLAPWNATMERGLIDRAYVETTGHPFIFTEYYWFGLAPAMLALLIALPLLGKRIPVPVRYTLCFGAAVGAIWLLTMQQTRYLLPALSALSVPAAWAAVNATRTVRHAAAALIGASTLWGLYLASFATVSLPGVVRTPDGPAWSNGSPAHVGLAAVAWPAVSGAQSADIYLATSGNVGAVAQASAWINENSAPNEKVALFDEVRGFYLDRPYAWAQPDHAEGLFPYDSYATPDAFADDFIARGYTLILHNDQGASDDRKWRPLLAGAIESGRAQLVQRFGRVKIYRLR